MSRKTYLFSWIIGLAMISLACGSLQVGVVSPTAENDPDLIAAAQTPQLEIITPTEEIPQPTDEPVEDFSHLWVEYRDPAYGYGVALPTHWKVNPTPTEGYDGAMTTASYDEAFFLAHSTKGWWNDNIIPEGVIKMDFAGMADEHPELDLASALNAMYSSQSDTTVVLSTEPVVYNGHEAILMTTASPNNLAETYTSVAFRLPNEKILLVTAFWGDAFHTPDVQAILNSFAYEGESVTLPTIAPNPPLSETPIDETPSLAEPGALPSSAACDSGYLGNLEDMLDTLQYNLEIGNYYPFSYMIGDPFVIGYWRSEAVMLPRAEAFAQLQENFFPAPEKVTFSQDPADIPNLEGTPLESLWGPEVDVAANIFSTGWGPNGQGEAILALARCNDNEQDTYFWYGMLYAIDGFE